MKPCGIYEGTRRCRYRPCFYFPACGVKKGESQRKDDPFEGGKLHKHETLCKFRVCILMRELFRGLRPAKPFFYYLLLSMEYEHLQGRLSIVGNGNG